MIRGSTLLTEARRADPYAGTTTVTPDLRPVARRIRQEATDDWDDTVAVERFEGKGGRLVRGSATPRRSRPGARGRRRLRGRPGRRGRGRSRSGRTPDRRPRRHPALDQPRGDRGPHRPAVAHSARRRRDRPGARADVRPLRVAGHGRRRDRPAAAPRGAGGRRGRRRRAACGRRRAAAGREGRARRGATATGSRSGSRTVRPSGRPSCSSPWAGVPGSRSSAWTPSGLTRTPAPWRSTSGCGPGSGCGRSATSRRRAASPTWRCTTRRSRWPTSSGRSTRRRTTRARRE